MRSLLAAVLILAVLGCVVWGILVTLAEGTW